MSEPIVPSRACPQLPLVFLFSMSSPVPNYLNLTYRPSSDSDPSSPPREFTSCKRFGWQGFSTRGCTSMLTEVDWQTFFDVDFDPEIVVGPKVLEFLRGYFMRHNSSIDVILTVLQVKSIPHCKWHISHRPIQIAHSKHFCSDPTSMRHLSRSSDDPKQSLYSTRLDQGWLLRPQPGQQLGVEFSKPAAIATIINNAREQFHSKHAFMFRYHDARTNGA